MKLKRVLKKQWANLLLGDFTPHNIALGVSLGTFVALLPTFGFSALLSLLIVFLFPKVNRPAIFFALIIWNPFVQIPVYALSFQLGNILFAGLPMVNYDIEILNQIYSFTRRFLIAHLIIVSVITLITYPLIKTIVDRKK